MLQMSERFYRILLRLYPAAHRREYGDLMAQLFHDLCKDAYRKRGMIGLLGLWLCTLADAFASAFIEHHAAWKKRLILYTPVTYRPRQILYLVLPLLGIILYIYAAHDYRDMAIIYILILITGAAAWVLNRLGLIPLNPIWNIYVIGILLGLISITLYIVSSIPALGVYRTGLPAFIIGIITTAFYLGTVAVTGRLMRPFTRVYRVTAGALAFVSVLAFIVSRAYAGNPDHITHFISLRYDLMRSLTTLLIAALGIQIARRYGRPGFVSIMLAYGVQFILVDPGYFTGYAGRWINLCVLLFPLAFCPAWWLLARSRRSQVRGTLVLWGILIGIIAVAPSLARIAMQLEYETSGMRIYRVLTAFPYFAAMWLALRVWHSSPERPIPAKGENGAGQTQPASPHRMS